MDKPKKYLVAYFTCSGVTKKLAETLAAATDADLFEIAPVTPYTAADLDWTNKRSRSSVEMSDPASRPPIAQRVAHMEAYDAVFVGFPIWWYVAPTIIHTFLESYDLSGKTIIPFATSGSSGMGKTDSVLRGLCGREVSWKPGKRLDAGASLGELKQWVQSLKL